MKDGAWPWKVPLYSRRPSTRMNAMRAISLERWAHT